MLYIYVYLTRIGWVFLLCSNCKLVPNYLYVDQKPATCIFIRTNIYHISMCTSTSKTHTEHENKSLCAAFVDTMLCCHDPSNQTGCHPQIVRKFH